jgi:hypothetical protein
MVVLGISCGLVTSSRYHSGSMWRKVGCMDDDSGTEDTMTRSTPTTRTDQDGVVRYELGDEFVTEAEYTEYLAAEAEALQWGDQ